MRSCMHDLSSSVQEGLLVAEGHRVQASGEALGFDADSSVALSDSYVGLNRPGSRADADADESAGVGIG